METIRLNDIRFSYDNKKEILKGINYTFEKGKIYAIVGPSGCGKTTLLSLLGGLDSPTSGTIFFDSENIETKGLGYHRKKRVSFIFQNYNLIDYLTPLENVQLTTNDKNTKILEKVGLVLDEMKRSVTKLSGGQQQRVAIARALAHDANVILADEPTGNLDEATGEEITQLLKTNAYEMNKCVIIVTHSNHLAKEADVVLRLSKGEIKERKK